MAISIALLKAFELFKELPDPLLEKLASQSHLADYAKRQVVLEARANSESVFLLFEGRLQGIDFTLDGKEVGLYFIEPGDIFGEISLFDQSIQNEVIIATAKSRVLHIPKKLFAPIMTSSPALMNAIFQRMANRIRILTEQRNLLSINNIPQRVGSLIWMMLPHKEASNDNLYLSNPPTHQEIGMMLNLSRETVTRVFKMLQEQGLVKKDGSKRLIILNAQSFIKLINGKENS